MKQFSAAVAFSLVALAGLRGAEKADATIAASDPRRPAAIATENVPRVPAEIFERLIQYQSIRAAGFGGWNPTGEGMIIHTRFGNSVQVHYVREPGSRREQLTFMDEPVRGELIPGVRDGALLLTYSRGGSENDQVMLLDRANWRSVELTDGKSRNLLGPVRRDGSQMIVHSNQRNGRDVDIYVANPREPGSMKLLFSRPGEYWSARDWSPDGTQLLVSRYVSINESYPALLDAESGKLEPLPLPVEGAAAVGAMAYGVDGRYAYLTCDSRGEFLQLYRLELATKKYELLTEDISWDVADIAIDKHSERVAFTVNENGAGRVYVLEGKERRRLELPLGTVGSLEFSPKGEQLGLTISRADAPAEAYSVGLSDGALTRWTYSETGGLRPDSFVQPQAIRFTSFDGKKIPAYVFKPKSAKNDAAGKAAKPAKRPVLISIHGGPESQYRPDFSPITQFYVNQLGVCYIAPNVRGSSGYGKSYLKLDNAMLREDSVKDIGGLLDWIAAQPDLDKDRVAVMGGSYGGFMTLASLVRFGDRFRAGIDVVGIANFITFLEQTSPYRQDLRRAEYGDERQSETREFFTRVSPALNADKIKSALLVIHGRNDPRVPFAEAQQIADRVRGTGRTVWTVYADNEGHGFAKRDNRDYQTAVEVLFLQQNLLPAK
ncbi:MAG: S9 family peptidase [Planctomycetes bacterium]|nr:S9 family peptidase [Planctomycetota bacterium]